jgi:O-acetyl-ADP-ribose deacetylase (regulator of RNase III)
MIRHVKGDILEAPAEALVNTVNTVGVMGKGIALQFRQAFPENYRLYRVACERGEVQPGRMFVVPTGLLSNPRLIVNFPTKRHWKSKSHIEDIETGLQDLVDLIRREDIHSIAIPPLGCGNGGLKWSDVRPRIERALQAVPKTEILLYEPAGAPNPDQMIVRTDPPKMTEGRAALLAILERYALPGYRITMLEIQKLLYFLQIAGEPLKLPFAKAQYGPYAESLHHVLQRLEGHFIRGYGDRSRESTIRLLSEAQEAARAYLEQHPKTHERIERVARLIEGFETPYGLELLSSIHWLAGEDNRVRGDVSAAGEGLRRWTERKGKLFQAHHVQVAWSQLREQGWI